MQDLQSRLQALSVPCNDKLEAALDKRVNEHGQLTRPLERIQERLSHKFDISDSRGDWWRISEARRGNG